MNQEMHHRDSVGLKSFHRLGAGSSSDVHSMNRTTWILSGQGASWALFNSDLMFEREIFATVVKSTIRSQFWPEFFGIIRFSPRSLRCCRFPRTKIVANDMTVPLVNVPPTPGCPLTAK